jgi:hypothetical protein
MFQDVQRYHQLKCLKQEVIIFPFHAPQRKGILNNFKFYRIWNQNAWSKALASPLGEKSYLSRCPSRSPGHPSAFCPLFKCLSLPLDLAFIQTLLPHLNTAITSWLPVWPSSLVCLPLQPENMNSKVFRLAWDILVACHCPKVMENRISVCYLIFLLRLCYS